MAAHGPPGASYGVGANSLEFCRALHTCDTAASKNTIRGIQAVLARETTTFSCEHACDSTVGPSWFLIRVTRLDDSEGVRIVVAHKDVSEIKRADDTLRRQQEALIRSEKLVAMSGLLANVAHELKKPLAVIMIQSDMLREQVSNTGLAEVVTNINESALCCERIVQNFLTLARPHTPECTRVQLNEVITDVMYLLHSTLQLAVIPVAQHLAVDLPVLWGDPHQLQQVIVNLVTNAQQALQETPSPHQITITTRYDTTLQQITLEVMDTGPGIRPDLQNRIFDPFFATKPFGVGTGLGLPLCQSTVQGHGGRLGVESQEDEGVRFTVELPLGEALQPVAAAAPEAASRAPVTGKALLVVDDEVGAAKALVRLFQRDGHTVDTAGNGHEALARLRLRSYDLILCDLRMPRLDGPGLYCRVAQEQPHLPQRFVFLTGDTLSPEARQFLEGSGVPYLVKPFRATAIRQLVVQMLQRLEAL